MIDLHASEPPTLHRDIKPSNCLLKIQKFKQKDDEDLYSLILTDFGISVFMVKIN